MQNHARKMTQFIFVPTLTFFNLKIDLVDFLVKVLTLLTFLLKMQKCEKYNGAKLGYDTSSLFLFYFSVPSKGSFWS
jgi:hypothetical protein